MSNSGNTGTSAKKQKEAKAAFEKQKQDELEAEKKLKEEAALGERKRAAAEKFAESLKLKELKAEADR